MLLFWVGLLVGASCGCVVMGLLASGSYERGAAEMVETIARRRKAGSAPQPIDSAKPWTW